MSNNLNICFISDNNNEYIFDSDTSIIFEKNHYEKRIEKITRMKKSIQLHNSKEYNKNDIENYIFRFGLTQLILEVTNSCNFHCKYCIFSEYYPQHSKLQNENMSFETAQKAIDIYINLLEKGKLYNPARIPIISFYGGEPLLNFDLIRKCVTYIKKRYKERVLFSITTNAYLLNNKISKFMTENNFRPIFSLDGPQIIHNKRRKLIGDKDTFERVYQNIKNYTYISNSIAMINSVYDYETDMEKLMDFWSQQNEMILVSLSPVNPYNTDYYNQFDDKTIKEFFEKESKLYNYFYNLSKTEKLTPKEIKEKNFLNIFLGLPISSIYTKEILKNTSRNIIKCTGSCIPGYKIFVDVKGDMYPCEKVDKSMIIGDITRGLNYSMIFNYMKEFEEKITSNCLHCTVKNVCSLCYQSLHSEKGFYKDEQNCINMRESYKALLSRAVSLSEVNSEWFVKFTTQYYKDIKELAVMLK